MNRFVFKRIIIILLLLSPSRSFADGDAGQAGEFLRYGVGARALGMGRAFTAVADDATAIYWNPGGLIGLEDYRVDGMLMYSELYEKSAVYYVSGAISLKFVLELLKKADSQHFLINDLRNWSLGFAWLQLTSAGFEYRDQFNNPNVSGNKTFCFSERALLFAIARSVKPFNQELGIGLCAKHLSQGWSDLPGSVSNGDGSGTGWDLGIRFTPGFLPSFAKVQFGFVLQNFNEPRIKFNSGAEDVIPKTDRFGIAIMPETEIRFLNSFLVSIDCDAKAPKGRDRNIYLGIECDLIKIWPEIPVRLRLGSNTANEKLSLGFSINLAQRNKIFSKKYLPRFDYAISKSKHDVEALGWLEARISLAISNPKRDKEYYEEAMLKFLLANSENPIIAYEEYLRRYPDIKLKKRIKNKLIAEYEKIIKKCPGTEKGNKAKKRVKELESESR